MGPEHRHILGMSPDLDDQRGGIALVGNRLFRDIPQESFAGGSEKDRMSLGPRGNRVEEGQVPGRVFPESEPRVQKKAAGIQPVRPKCVESSGKILTDRFWGPFPEGFSVKGSRRFRGMHKDSQEFGMLLHESGKARVGKSSDVVYELYPVGEGFLENFRFARVER